MGLHKSPEMPAATAARAKTGTCSRLPSGRSTLSTGQLHGMRGIVYRAPVCRITAERRISDTRLLYPKKRPLAHRICRFPLGVPFALRAAYPTAPETGLFRLTGSPICGNRRDKIGLTTEKSRCLRDVHYRRHFIQRCIFVHIGQHRYPDLRFPLSKTASPASSPGPR